MKFASLSTRSLRPLTTAVIVVVSLIYFLYPYFSSYTSAQQQISYALPWRYEQIDQSSNILIPEDYSLDKDQSDYCRDQFSIKYLTNLRDANFEYCNASSTSSLTCFHSHTHRNGQPDSLCIAKRVVHDQNSHFLAHCHIEQPDENATARGITPFDGIRQYWYDTGARFLLDNYMQFVPEVQTSVQHDANTPSERRFTLLLKREGEGNLWHCMMEIWSMAMTIDVLRMSPDPEDNGRPFFRVPEDLANMQVVVLDDRVDGPYFDLWKLFSGRTPIRDYQISGNPEAVAFFQNDSNVEHRVIFPLAGATNPMWHSDWDPVDCTHSDTLQVFMHRVLEQYHVETPPSSWPTIRLTFIDRKDIGKRNLINEEALLAAVKARFGSLIEVEAIDFGTLSFAEQLQVDRRTDILVGIHGGGMTHTMFLRERVTAVVELQPADMESPNMVFRNLANMRGIGYFRTCVQPVPEKQEDNGQEDDGQEDDGQEEMRANEKRDDKDLAPALEKRYVAWDEENFEMDESAFIEVIEMAVKSLYNKGLRNMNVL